jgi:hypothetical protein
MLETEEYSEKRNLSGLLNLEKARKWPLLQSLQKQKAALLMSGHSLIDIYPGYWPRTLIHLCTFKPLSLWQFVSASIN